MVGGAATCFEQSKSEAAGLKSTSLVWGTLL